MFAQHGLLETFNIKTRAPLVDTYIKFRERRAVANNHRAATIPILAQVPIPRLRQCTLSPSYREYFAIGPEIVDSSPVQRSC
jgi:hypothetical protein